MEKKNTNCLEGFHCPACGYTEQFYIWCNTVFRVDDQGTEHTGDTEWNEDNHCACGKCRYESNVRDFTRPILPPDPDGMNGDRASWAEGGLGEYCNLTRRTLEAHTQEDVLCNLLGDLRHWCDRKGIDFAKCDRRGQRMYQDEICPLDPNADAIDREENQD